MRSLQDLFNSIAFPETPEERDIAELTVRDMLTPRRITTVEELDTLPLGSIVACLSHSANIPVAIVFQRGSNTDGGAGWTTPEAIGQIPAEGIFEFIALNGFPTTFTVLHNPQEASWGL